MKTVLAQHRWTNGALVRVSCVEREPNVPKGDFVLLEIKTANGDVSGYVMRPDEAIVLIEKLASGLYRMIKGYKIGLLKKRRRKTR